MKVDWLLLQLADSAFPTGGFAHSGGLEAAVQLTGREFVGVRAFAEAALWQAGHGALPFVRGAHRDPERFGELDARCDAFVSNHVANGASRAQGRALIATCARVYGGNALRALDDRVRARRTPGHWAPLLGAAAGALGLGLDEAQALALHLALRQVTSAAVRLGVAGTLEAQRMQFQLAGLLDEVRAACSEIEPEHAAQTAPVLDLFASLHDKLAARMFVT